MKALAASVLSQDETPAQKVTTFTIRPGTDFGWKVFEGKVQIAFSPRKLEAIRIAKRAAAKLRPSRFVRTVGKRKIVKVYK